MLRRPRAGRERHSSRLAVIISGPARAGRSGRARRADVRPGRGEAVLLRIDSLAQVWPARGLEIRLELHAGGDHETVHEAEVRDRQHRIENRAIVQAELTEHVNVCLANLPGVPRQPLSPLEQPRIDRRRGESRERLGMMRDTIRASVRARYSDGDRLSLGARQRGGLEHDRLVVLQVGAHDLGIQRLHLVHRRDAAPSVRNAAIHVSKLAISLVRWDHCDEGHCVLLVRASMLEA